MSAYLHYVFNAAKVASRGNGKLKQFPKQKLLRRNYIKLYTN
jgi:hypothetical protein